MSYTEVHNGLYNSEEQDTFSNLKYELSDFQKHAFNAIRKSENVLVCAHTGSGKTLVGIESISKARHENKNAIYISPIKALSNQKFKEFTDIFPDEKIALITGDIKINMNGNIVIVTAEIFRNKILKKDNSNNEWDLDLNSIGCIILDEFHMINNVDRGRVFEEIIINLDPKIQIIMLSATLSEPFKMCEWIGNLKKKKCHLVTTSFRIVPLKHGIWFNNEINYFLHGDKDWKKGVWTDTALKINKFYKTNQYNLNEFFNCVKYLYNNDMCPCIFFLLNRELCYKYAEKIPIIMLTPEETNKVQIIWNNYLHKYKHLYEFSEEYINLYKLVQKGIGYHHSGMIILLKEIVEILYAEELIKVLMVTETFAMGINMSIKTVVFCSVTKFDNQKRILKSEEYQQMAGRAGRRGKDLLGTVIILPSKDFIDEEQAKKMILSPPQKIISKFSINITFVLKQLDIDNNNIYENCYNSLFHYQEYNEENYNIVLEKLSHLTINNESLEIYNKIKIIDDQIKNFKLKSNQLIKLKSEKEELSNKINISLVETYIKLKSELDNLEILKNKIKINDQVNIIINFLKNNNFITNSSNNLLTKYGKILSEINECNAFILGYIIFSDSFDNLEFSEIVAICSILINESSKSYDEIFINDLNCTEYCKELLLNIDIQIEKFYKLEDELNKLLPYPTWLDWNINYNLFNLVKSWANGSNGNEFINGNFIKTILRLNNLLANIENIAKLYNNINLLNKLYGYQEKLIRDTVISDSLYLI
jgi:superfamily II RNA helicase